MNLSLLTIAVDPHRIGDGVDSTRYSRAIRAKFMYSMIAFPILFFSFIYLFAIFALGLCMPKQYQVNISRVFFIHVHNLCDNTAALSKGVGWTRAEGFVLCCCLIASTSCVHAIVFIGQIYEFYELTP